MVTTGKGADSTETSLVSRVRTAIKDAGINHSEVARQIELDASKLSKSLATTRKFRVEEISRIAELTGVTTDWLTTGKTVRPPRRKIGIDVPADTAAPTSDTQEVAAAHNGGADGGAANGSAPAHEWMSKGTRNRLKIIAATWRLYADLGIDKVRTEDVADAAGVTTSAVNYHFRTKDQLLQSALRHSLDVIAETRHLNDSADPVGVLRHFARIHAGVDPKIRRVWSIWLQCWARAATDESARANLTAVYGEWMDMITTIIDSGQRTGAIRTGNTALMVKSLSIFIDGLGVARTTEHMPITDEEALTMLENYLAAHVLIGDAFTDDTRTPKSDRVAAAGRPEPTS
ncbi:TetR family transcriptional regulator C-terminal domain-containing protein [Brevibacterium sp. CFH 10365]|uniref:TetR family transcriptional regulator C-terminal domain-containing protein n=1 Tax=Brevibacterium sp. CFH 10365 TaxID=2585207 RepID=UPI001D0D31BE|nr:TetR family transcriptional regulator C-terminal domain-containing protein [Brevibacterium sp. CFH 10365]